MVRVIPLFTLLCLMGAAYSNPSCPPATPGMLTVHLICHTHDDVGWLKTVDQYYYGARNNIQRAGVQYILNSVVNELLKDDTRKFSYVESAFFYRWWEEQTPKMKEIVQSLVASGQLELVNGGWCMNDEATPHYSAIIDQMTLGLVFLNQTFGPDARPRVAWQIDPFGHSNEQASLFAQMGFDGLFFGRLDFNDKDKRWDNKDLEMVWQPSKSLDKASSSLFTGVLPNGYNPPSGFCFDDTCSDEPIMDDPRMEDYNVNEKVMHFLAAVNDQAKAYRSSNIIMTMGSDFQYQNAGTWYTNLDKLIKYVNLLQEFGSNITVTYSTPSCYLDAVHKDQITFNTKQDDFFPYASDHHAYWTGYFTSRPALKGYVRKTNGYFQALKQVKSLQGTARDTSIETLAKAMGIAQHHDAVSGTAKQHVTDDYVKTLYTAHVATQDAMADGLKILSIGNTDKLSTNEATLNEAIPTSFCPMANISSCAFTETQPTFQVLVYNSVARPVSHIVRIPVPSGVAYKVTDYQGNGLSTQLVPIPEAVMKIAYRSSNATFELVFKAEDVPALGSATFVVSMTDSDTILKSLQSRRREVKEGVDTVVEHGPMSVTLDGTTGLMKSFSIKTSEGVKTTEMSQEIMWYKGMKGYNNGESNRASGAYIFRPDGTRPHALDKPTNVVYEGDVVYEIQQEFGSWASQVVRLYKGSYHIEVEWMVGPIPVNDRVGKEVITRYTLPAMTTNGAFYTDANGREMQKRVKNHRDTWQLNVTEPVAGNYYPVTSRIMLHSTDDQLSFAVLNDRSQGGSSINEGQVELMVHRRLLFDDAFGVGEPLNEVEYGQGLIVRGTHLLVHSDFTSSTCDFACLHRNLAEQLLMKPVVVYRAPASAAAPPAPISGLTKPLPDQVHLLTLEPWYSEGELLLRLENMYEVGESEKYSVPVTVDLEDMFADWRITSAKETVLSANMWREDSDRLHWKVADETENKRDSHREENDIVSYTDQSFADVHPRFRQPLLAVQRRMRASELSVTLKPMEIRSFLITVEKKPH